MHTCSIIMIVQCVYLFFFEEEWFNCVCGWLVEFANLLHVCNF